MVLPNINLFSKVNKMYWAIGIGVVIIVLAIAGYVAWTSKNARALGRDEGQKIVVKRDMKARNAKLKEAEVAEKEIKAMTGQDMADRLNGQYSNK